MALVKEFLKKESSICGAIKGSGEVCTRIPSNEKNLRCCFHGGKSTGATTEEEKQNERKLS